MKLLTLRKSQFRKLGKEGSYVKMVALFLEMRMNPLDEFEKAFAEAYLMKIAQMEKLSDQNNREADAVEEIDPFA
jgi:hypothetical protein